MLYNYLEKNRDGSLTVKLVPSFDDFHAACKALCSRQFKHGDLLTIYADLVSRAADVGFEFSSFHPLEVQSTYSLLTVIELVEQQIEFHMLDVRDIGKSSGGYSFYIVRTL